MMHGKYIILGCSNFNYLKRLQKNVLYVPISIWKPCITKQEMKAESIINIKKRKKKQITKKKKKLQTKTLTKQNMPSRSVSTKRKKNYTYQNLFSAILKKKTSELFILAF